MSVFLDKYKIKEEEEKPFSFLDKYKFTAEAGIGAKAEMGVTLPKPIPPEPLETPGISQRMRGIGEAPKEYPIEGITVELKEASGNLSSLWWSEFKTTEDKWKFLKHENWSPELQEADLQVQRLSEQASKMGVNTGDWIEYGVYMTFFAGMAASILPVLKGMPTEVLNKVKYKVGDKTVKGKELFDTIRRVAYSDSPKYPDPSKFDKEVFKKLIEKGGVKGIGSLAKGITMPTVEPRFAFGTKLYSGLPIDEMVKLIVKAGKITKDIDNALKVMNPVDTGLVFQQLSIASPAIAEKIASEFVKLIPQEIKKIPKAGEEMTPEEAEAFERLKAEKIIPEEEVEPTKVELEEIEKVPTPKEKFMAKMEEIKKAKEVPEKITQDLAKKVEVPVKISKEIFKESISESESIIEKQSIKERTVEGVKSGELTGAVRFGSAVELEKTLKEGKLPVSEEYDEIHAQPIIDKDDDYFAVYGPYNKHTIGIVIPKEYIQQKPDAHTKEVIVNPDVPIDKLKFIIKDQVYDYDEITETIETKIPEEMAIPIKPKIEKPERTYELKKDLAPEQKIKGNKLIGQIHKVVSNKGLTKVEFTALKRKYGLSPHLATDTRRMTMPQLQAVLKAVEKARPKIVGHRKVVTLKTENKIQTLKENLITNLQMTEEVYQGVLKDVGVYKEPKYVDAKQFITEKQGKDVIYRLIDESNILKVTIPFERAVTENKPIKADVDKLDVRIKSEGVRRAKDPHELSSMRTYAQTMEATTGTPIYTLYQDLINAHLENKQKLSDFIRGFNPYEEIIKDEKELKKVNDYILAKSNLKDKPPVPKNMTDKEIKLAKKIEAILKDYEAKARTEKFLDNIDHPEDMPQYIEFKKEIDKAKDIYESKGYDDLVKYMETQKWGVIKSGYSPLQVISPRIRLYKPKAQTFGKTHIKTRTDIEYHEQDRNIIQRLYSYKKQMDNLVIMRPKVRALITLIDKDLDKFKDPQRISRNMEAFFRELKGYNRPENWFDRGLNRLYAQAMQTIIMPSPVLSGRNLLQNIAFGHDKSLLIDPRNKSLTDEDLSYFDTYISQLQAMNLDWFMTGEKPLPGLVRLTKMVRKIGIYPYSDLANRHWGYWAKINQIKRAFAKDVPLTKQMKSAKFSDMELIEQKMALQILAKDGKEAMARYVARVYVDNTQFLYDRSQRSLAEMGRVGKWAGNLMLFPRAYWEMLLKQSKKMTGKYVPGRERVRAFKVLAAVIGGGILVGAAYKKVTGRRENPYDPLVLLAYEPGGLAIGTVEAVTDVYVNILMASKGDDRALAALTTAIPKAADMFIPFYSYTLRAFEASTDTKNIDAKALRKIRMLIDNEYKLREGAYILERNAMEKWQYFLSGAGVDVIIKKRKAEEKKTKSPYLDKYKEETITPSTYLQKYKR